MTSATVTFRTTHEPFADLVPPSVAFPTRKLEPGDVLFEAGREPQLLYLVDDGILEAIVPTSLGRKRVADLYGSGDVIGLAALCDDLHFETVVALEEATLVPLVPRYALKDERLNRYILRNLAEQFRRNRVALAESELPVGARLARLMLHLSERFGHKVKGGRSKLPLALTHDDLADMAQSSRVTVTRVMGELRQEGAVFGTRGDYEIDPVTLKAAAEHYVLQAL